MITLNPNPKQAWLDVCALADITANTGVTALIGIQQIAIFRVADEQRVYALSNQDPLSKAFVISRGIIGDVQGERVVASPLYKQHFSLTTGRCLEDAQQKLSVFPSKIENGRVLISPIAEKKYITHTVTLPSISKLVLIGNSLVAIRCLQHLLARAPERYEITVINAEAASNPKPNIRAVDLAEEHIFDGMIQQADIWYQTHKIKFMAEHVAVRIDRLNRHVHTQQGAVVAYDRLLLATGSHAVIPMLQGVALHGVMDFQACHLLLAQIQAEARSQKHVVVLGGDLIGVETAFTLRKAGLQVSLIHAAEYLLEGQLDIAASQLLKNLLTAQGITVLTAAHTEALLGVTEHIRQVQLSDGRKITADFVVVALATQPNIALAQAAGLPCQHGIWVNDTMQSYDPRIYAIGECVEYAGQSFNLATALSAQAFVCASHLAEQGYCYFKTPLAITQFELDDCAIFSAGDIRPWADFDDIILHDERAQTYKRMIIQKDKLVGVVLFGDVADAAWYAELIQHQTSIATIRHKLMFGQDFALKS